MLTPKELESMRRDADGLRPETAKIERYAKTLDNKGGRTRAISVVDEEAPVRISTPEATTAILENRDVDTLDAAFAQVQDIRKGDLVTIGGKRYTVITVARGHSWEVERRVRLSEVV